MFKTLENNKPFLKLALEGFAGDGKTYTAIELAIGTYKLINSKKPIALFDTERALKALKFKFDENGIQAVINDENRSLEALRQSIEWCENGGADILVIDSITHVWDEFLQAYMKQKNRSRLEFQDWGVIKPMWKEKFSNRFVMSNVHIIFTGRAGFEYDNEINEQTGKREIHKSGIKMKAEGETAFEPDILVLMEKDMKVLGDVKTVTRNATIIKDRTTRIDGKTFINPTFNDFYPAIKQLLEGTVKFNLGGVEIPDTFEDFENKYSAIGKRKDKAINEIDGAFKIMGLGTGAEHQKTKCWIVKKVFGINSPDNLNTIKAEELETGLVSVNKFSEAYQKYLVDCLVNETKADPTHVLNIMNDILNPPPTAEQTKAVEITNPETTKEATDKYNAEQALLMKAAKKSAKSAKVK